MRIRTHAPTIGLPSIRGGRTRNCHAASRIAFDSPDPRGDSPSWAQFSTWLCAMVWHAISAQLPEPTSRGR